MRTSSLFMLVLAILFGTAAVFVTRAWLESQQNSVVGPAEANLSPTQTVVVAAVPLRFGDRLQRDNLREIAWPSGNLPTGAFTQRDEVLEEGERFVLTPLEANEPVLSWKITGPGQRASLSTVVERGMRAVTIRINDVLGVAGFVLPGDRVDIMLTRNPRGSEPYTDVLLQGVRVLAIDQLADERRDQPSVSRTVTVEVDTEQAQKLTLAANVGQLSLALRNVVQVEGQQTRRVTLEDLNIGESQLPPGEVEAPPVYKPTGPNFTTIGVTRRTQRSEYQVRSKD
jgi:pilus assembly protein CpaB